MSGSESRLRRYVTWLRDNLDRELSGYRLGEEYRTLRMLADGHTLREIAGAEGVDEPTIEQRVATLRQKYNAATDAQLIAEAVRAHELDPI